MGAVKGDDGDQIDAKHATNQFRIGTAVERNVPGAVFVSVNPAFPTLHTLLDKTPHVVATISAVPFSLVSRDLEIVLLLVVWATMRRFGDGLCLV